MSPSVTDVLSWEPSRLATASERFAGMVEALDSVRAGMLQEQDALAETWNGDAAVAAAARVVGECALVRALADIAQRLSAEFGSSAALVDEAARNVGVLVREAEARGFEVDASGTITANRIANLLNAMGTPASQDAAIAIRIEATQMSIRLLEALQQAGAAADTASSRLDAVRQDSENLAMAGSAGTVVEDGHGDFSWQPDCPATFASATIGVMTDVTGRGLTSAAVSSVDDVARLIGRGLGPAGAVLGVVPAISNDIAGGMSPSKAIVTEGVGAAGGLAAGTYFGSVVGGVVGTAIPVPFIATAVGVAVGAAVGGGVGWGGSKLLQLVWD